MNFTTFYNNPENSDVIIKHKEGMLYGHQIILKIASPVFAMMLKRGTREIDLTDFDSASVLLVIKQMYHVSEILIESCEMLENLIAVVDFLDYQPLRAKIIMAIKNNNITRVPELHPLIVKYNLKELSHVIVFLAANKFCQRKPAIIESSFLPFIV